MPTEESKLTYGHIDTFNSKINPLMTILSQNREEQKYIDLPTSFPYLNEPPIIFL